MREDIEIIRENERPEAKKPWSTPYVIVGTLDQSELNVGLGADGGAGGISHS